MPVFPDLRSVLDTSSSLKTYVLRDDLWLIVRTIYGKRRFFQSAKDLNVN